MFDVWKYASVQSAVDAAIKAGGGTVYCPSGTYELSNTVVVNHPGVRLQGDGFDVPHNTGGNVDHPTAFTWSGVPGGTMVRFTAQGSPLNRYLGDNSIDGIALLGGGIAGIGLDVVSVRGGRFRAFTFNHTIAGVRIGVIPGAERHDTQCNEFWLWIRQLGQKAPALVLEGDATANTSMNRFGLVDIQANLGDGIEMRNTDHNRFERARVTGLTEGKGLVFYGSDSSAGEVARRNHFVDVSIPGPKIVARGLSSHKFPSAFNVIDRLDVGNNKGRPTVETGATLWWATDQNPNHILSGEV